MAAFLKPTLGSPGRVSRPGETLIVTAMLHEENPPDAFGIPVKLVDGKLQKMEASDTGDDVFGILGLVTPSQSDPDDPNKPNATTKQSVVVKGYVNVKCASGGQPVRGSTVYMRTNINAAGTEFPGLISAKKSSANFSGIKSAVWTSDGKDENLIAELRLGKY